jgi:hypothetical protein
MSMWLSSQQLASLITVKKINRALRNTDIPHLMTKERSAEKRRYERVRLSLNVNWGLTGQCANDGRVTSISLGGCFLQTSFKLLIDQVVFLRLSLRTEHILRCRVRYTLLQVGSGIEFVELTEEDRAAVRELIAYYRPSTSA